MTQIWYFARDDRERGPFTESQMRTLASAGKLRQSDLVWKEGTTDWVMASEADELQVPTLEPPPQHSSDSSPSATRDALDASIATPREVESNPAGPSEVAQPAVSPVARESKRTARAIAYLLIAIGFLAALAAKGLEGLMTRNVERLDAIVALQQSEFEAAWGGRLERLREERAGLQDARVFDVVKQNRMGQIENEIHQLASNRDQSRRELEQGLWREQRRRAADAKLHDKIWAFWRQLGFIVATAFFCAGLFTMGLVGEMAERSLSLAIMAVIAYSLFMGGQAWF